MHLYHHYDHHYYQLYNPSPMLKLPYAHSWRTSFLVTSAPGLNFHFFPFELLPIFCCPMSCPYHISHPHFKGQSPNHLHAPMCSIFANYFILLDLTKLDTHYWQVWHPLCLSSNIRSSDATILVFSRHFELKTDCFVLCMTLNCIWQSYICCHNYLGH